ncbi:MAG: cryptochrome/photolyase family protein [Rubricoccaceae bacterium]
MAGATLVWFRRDLRLADHAPLAHAAAREGTPVVPVFVWAPEEEAPWPPGGAHRWWLGASLEALGQDLAGRGLRLVLRRGSTAEALRTLAREAGADRVVFSSAPEPHLARRDAETAAALREDGLDVRAFAGHLLHAPDEVRTGSGGPYRVFTPFWRKLSAALDPPAPLPVPRLGATRAPAAWPESVPLAALGLAPEAQDGVDWAGAMRAHWRPGEAGAHDRLARFLDEALVRYPEARNVPAARGSSELSPHLRWGEISPRQVWHAVNDWVRNGPMRAAADVFLAEIGWREFSYHILHHFPHTDHAPLDARYEALPWRDDPEGLAAWQRGRTGYPVVDAAMRQLWALGWMHNRLRMIAASFLTKDLLVRWQDGAAWFWDTLCDGDLASNSLGWQWSAGSGADAQPFFRIFNPVAQGEKFDPEGTFVRHWLPELGNVPARFIHRPWEAPPDVLRRAGVALGETYPRPLVDHARARKRALDALHSLRD